MTHTALRITVAEDATYVARDRIPKRGRRTPQHALRIDGGRILWCEHPEGGIMGAFEGSLDHLVQIIRRQRQFAPEVKV